MSSRPDSVSPSGPVQATLTSRVPLPEIHYETANGTKKSLSGHVGKPLLVNLWASWCLPCLEELNEFKQNWHKFQKSGIDVLALSVDGLDDEDGIQKANAIIQEMEFPFASGWATPELVDKLQLLHDHLFLPHQPPPKTKHILTFKLTFQEKLFVSSKRKQ